MMRYLCTFIFLIFSTSFYSQSVADIKEKEAKDWADSVYKKLSNDERIAQLMIVRLSALDGRKPVFYGEKVSELVRKYNIGGLCVFQGGPQQQAYWLNRLQEEAKTPLMICVDAEWGLGMRITDSVMALPRQMMLGAVTDTGVIYQYGKVVANQLKRLGIHVNYAPVVDVNNNPANPVINDRSFGEDKYRVAAHGIAYMKGMQDNGIMACAKHFPGHGDVAVDSHLDLPVINKTREQLDSLELYPFRKLFEAGVGSAMIAHLYIPSIDNRPNRATSISKNNVTHLLREELGFNGLTFTDALEMKGVSKFFPKGDVEVESIIAGNDMLCLPEDVPVAIKKIKEAIKEKRLTWKQIEFHAKRVLQNKYMYGMHKATFVKTRNLYEDLNSEVPSMRSLVAENAITLVSGNDRTFFPLSSESLEQNIAYVGIGPAAETAFGVRMEAMFNAAVYYADPSKMSRSALESLLLKIRNSHEKVVIGIHGLTRSTATNYGLTASTVKFVSQLQQISKSITIVFGNAYAAKNWCGAANLVVAYEDDEFTQGAAARMLAGRIPFKGKLPVTICPEWTYGHGIATVVEQPYYRKSPLFDAIDSITSSAIKKKAMPGAVLLAAQHGKIIYHKAYGTKTYEGADAVNRGSIFDLASLTKIFATTLSIMKLYDEKKIELKSTVGDYLPDFRNSDIGHLRIDKILLHEAGLVSYIPFHKETLDASGNPRPDLYRSSPDSLFSIRVATGLYLRNDWKDSMIQRMRNTAFTGKRGYVYSDNDFILLGRIVEQVSGMSLDAYAKRHFYEPMRLSTLTFNPLNEFPADRIVPTEQENIFRKQLLLGSVHDPGAAMLGGIAGHAGLFGDARDLACLMQMLLNKGTFNGRRYIDSGTVQLFTQYGSMLSRRGLGFDKPEKNNDLRRDPYPSRVVSPATFGHTGYTGTSAWADPQSGILFILLTNRVYPDNSFTFQRQNIREKLHELIYRAAENINHVSIPDQGHHTISF